jgi:hypothetical protein
MQFAVKQVCAGGAKAHAGLLQIGSSSIETPALLLSTCKGLSASNLVPLLKHHRAVNWSVAVVLSY